MIQLSSSYGFWGHVACYLAGFPRVRLSSKDGWFWLLPSLLKHFLQSSSVRFQPYFHPAPSLSLLLYPASRPLSPLLALKSVFVPANGSLALVTRPEKLRVPCRANRVYLWEHVTEVCPTISPSYDIWAPANLLPMSSMVSSGEA